MRSPPCNCNILNPKLQIKNAKKNKKNTKHHGQDGGMLMGMNRGVTVLTLVIRYKFCSEM